MVRSHGMAVRMQTDIPKRTKQIMLRLVAFLLLTIPAFAQSGWVDKLTNGNGMVCCYDSDGRRLDDPEWRTKGNGYEVLFTEGWIDVPDYAIVKMPNRDGIARVWSEFSGASDRAPARA